MLYLGDDLVTDAPVTDHEIAILCDVLEGQAANFRADKKRVLEQLIARGLVTVFENVSAARYELTGKAQQLLAERGVGVSGG